jgi:hypothetical protein
VCQGYTAQPNWPSREISVNTSAQRNLLRRCRMRSCIESAHFRFNAFAAGLFSQTDRHARGLGKAWMDSWIACSRSGARAEQSGAPRGREEVASPSRTHPGGRGGHLPLQTRPGPSQRYIEHFDVSVTLPSSLTLWRRRRPYLSTDYRQQQQRQQETVHVRDESRRVTTAIIYIFSRPVSIIPIWSAS